MSTNTWGPLSATSVTAGAITSNVLLANNFGINTATPQYSLDVYGNGHFTSTVAMDGGSYVSQFSTSTARPSAGQYIWFDRSYGLELQSSLTNALPTGSGVATSFLTRATDGCFVFKKVNQTFSAADTGTPLMVINNSGQVGIGTVTPTASNMLDVGGNVRMQQNAVVSGSLYANTGTVTSNLSVGNLSQLPAFPLDVTGTGNFRGDGTQYNQALRITESTFGGSARAAIRYGTGWEMGQDVAGTGATTGNRNFYLYNSLTASTAALLVSNTNNVGINLNPATSPVYNLDVNGTIRSSGLVTANAGIQAATYATLTGTTVIDQSANVTTPALFLNGTANVIGSNFIRFGAGVSGQQTDAGKMGYQTFTAGALDIIGAGTAALGRNIKLWDNVSVVANLTSASLSTTNAVISGNIGLGSQVAPSYPIDYYGAGANSTAVPLRLQYNGGQNNTISIQTFYPGILFNMAQNTWNNTGTTTPCYGGIIWQNSPTNGYIQIAPTTGTGLPGNTGSYANGIYITPQSQLGVNQPNPACNLDITGNVRHAGATYLTGTSNSVATGGHLTAYTTSDTYPLLQSLNYAHDNVSLNFDVAYNGSNWISSSGTAGYSINKSSGALNLLYYASTGAGNVASNSSSLTINRANVGIGTAQPAVPLDVNGSARIVSTSPQLELQGATHPTPASIVFNTFGANFGNQRITRISAVDDGNSGGTLYTYTGNVIRTTILNNGNVGFGITQPAYPLDVSGVINVRGDGTQYNQALRITESTFGGSARAAIRYGTGWEMGQDVAGTGATTGNRNFYLYNSLTASTAALLVSNTNNVGINLNPATSPVYNLDVNGTIRSSGLVTANAGILAATHATLTGTTVIDQSANVYTPALFLNGTANVSGGNFIRFGAGVSGQQTDAGKMGYQTFTAGALDIVGAGTAALGRNIKLWDNVSVVANLTSASLSTTNAVISGNIGLGSQVAPVYPIDYYGAGANSTAVPMRLQYNGGQNNTVSIQTFYPGILFNMAQNTWNNTGTTAPCYGGIIWQNSPTNGYIQIAPTTGTGLPGNTGSYANGIYITPQSQLGVNQPNPACNLDVTGNVRHAGATYLTGTSNNVANGGHLTAYTTSDTYPLLQSLNYAHDNVSLSFDVAYNGSSWISSSGTAGYSINKSSGALNLLYYASTGAGNVASNSSSLTINRANVGIGTAQPAYTLDANGVVNARGDGTQYTKAFRIAETTFAGSARAAIAFGPGWEMGQDFAGTGASTGNRNFYLYNSLTGTSPLCVSNTNNVGVNMNLATQPPAYSLDVNGATRFSPYICLTASSAPWDLTFTKGLFMRYSTVSGQDNAYIQSIDRSSGNTYALNLQAANISLDTPNISRMYISNTGNVGVGTTQPTVTFDVNGTAGISGANTLKLGTGVAGQETNAGRIGYQTFTTGALDIVGAGSSGGTRTIKLWDSVIVNGIQPSFFQTQLTAALVLGSPTTIPGTVSSGAGPNGVLQVVTGYQQRAGITTYAAGSGATSHVEFWNNTGSVNYCGSISTNNSTTLYNTSSDRRLKQDILALAPDVACETVRLLKPVTFSFKRDPVTKLRGFIADEVQEVIPEAVTGEPEAHDSEGRPVYQGVDPAKLVPTLTAALQKLIKQNEEIMKRLARLEAVNPKP